MKINDALLCLGCDEVFVPEPGSVPHEHPLMAACPSCTGTATVKLCRWISSLTDSVKEQATLGRKAA